MREVVEVSTYIAMMINYDCADTIVGVTIEHDT